MANEIILRAAASESFVSNPVPQEMRDQLSGDLLSFTTIPSLMKSNLSGLYPFGTDVMSALAQDWAESFAAGAIKLFDSNTVSFALSLELINGTPVEASIRRNSQDTGNAWYLAYTPNPSRVTVKRPAGQAPTAFIPRATYTDALPARLDAELLAMANTVDYANASIPAAVAMQMNSCSGNFCDFVCVHARWKETLRDLSGLNMDTVEFLNREWAFAQEKGYIRYFEGKVVFPISILRKDDKTPVEVLIKHNDKYQPEQPARGSFPWFVSYVESEVRTNTNPNRALREWAWLGDITCFLESLASMALPERWDFDESMQAETRYAILRNYICYTFYRLQAQGKVLESTNAGIAAFNTGLVDQTYEPIYACFSHSNQGLEWKFEAFCKAGSRGWGKKLVSTFNPLPERASYIDRKEDLLFDADSPLTPDTDHILLDNINRLPREFLEDELVGNSEALELIQTAFEDALPSNRETAFDGLSDLVEDNIKIHRRLKNRLDDAIDLARKRAEWNFKTAVPAWHPTRNTMSLLLPLDLTDDDKPDVALVVELTESGAYIGQTVLTMPMAYTNARLICRPDSDWLNTSLKLLADQDEED